MRSKILANAAFAALLAVSSTCFAQASSATTSAGSAQMRMPQASAVVEAQGTYALAQLRSFAAVYGADPSGQASREAFQNGWAPVNRSYASPSQSWPARGLSVGESIGPLLAQARAAQTRCDQYEGPCQDKAVSWAKKEVARIAKAKNPGAELALVVDQFTNPD